MLLAAMPAACTPITGDTGPGSSGASTGELRVRLQVQPGSIVRDAALSAFYARTGDATPRLLAARSVSVTPGTVTVPFVVPLTECLRDPDRTGSDGGACPIQVAIALRDADGVLLDSAVTPAIAARPGESIEAPPLAFAVPGSVALALPDTLRAGDTLTLTATVRDSTQALLTGRTIRWESSDPSVATVDAAGRLVVLRPGPVTITARAATATASVSRTVLPDVATVVIALPDTIRFRDIVTAVATARDRTGAVVSDQPVVWSTDAPSVATIDATGVLTAVGAGTVRLTATVAGRRADVDRTVRPEGLSSLYATYGYACGIGTSGRAYCWGSGGTFGNVTLDPQRRPTEMPGDSVLTQVTGGTNHICGLTRSGAMMCLGNNNAGSLGVGDLQPRDRFTLAATTAGPFVQVAAGGGSTSCARTASGEAWCAGFSLRIGTGLNPPGNAVLELSRVQLPPGTVLRDIGGAGITMCGMTVQNDVWCFGPPSPGYPTVLQSLGQFLPARYGFGPVAPVAISPGNGTVCVRDAAGAAYCWGQGLLENSQSLATPTRIASPAETPFTDVAAWGGSACGLTATGRVLCWGTGIQGWTPGLDGNGELGTVELALPSGVVPTKLVVFGLSACVETADGQPWCWGSISGAPGPSGGLVASRVPLPGEPTP